MNLRERNQTGMLHGVLGTGRGGGKDLQFTCWCIQIVGTRNPAFCTEKGHGPVARNPGFHHKPDISCNSKSIRSYYRHATGIQTCARAQPKTRGRNWWQAGDNFLQGRDLAYCPVNAITDHMVVARRQGIVRPVVLPAVAWSFELVEYLVQEAGEGVPVPPTGGAEKVALFSNGAGNALVRLLRL